MASLRDYNELIRYRLGIAKYFFVHIPKTGGVAVKRHRPLINQIISSRPFFYHDKSYVRSLREQMKLAGEHHGLAHARLLDISQDVLDCCRPFAIVRNPWARVVSRWKFGMLAIKQGSQPDNYVPDTFEEFLLTREIYKDKPRYWHRVVHGWYQQWDYICDVNQDKACDVLRFEEINDDVNKYFGLQAKELQVRNQNSLALSDYREYYTSNSMINQVATWYDVDISHFGFDFDKPAQKGLAV